MIIVVLYMSAFPWRSGRLDRVLRSAASLTGNVPSNFLKSVCAQNFPCATFYQHLYIFRITFMKYAQKHFLKENLCALHIFLCAHVSRPVCARTRAQLRRNIGGNVS